MNSALLSRALGRSSMRTTLYQSPPDVILILRDIKGIASRTHLGDHALWLDENQYDTRYGQRGIY